MPSRDAARLWRMLDEHHEGRASAIQEAMAAERLGWTTRTGKPDTRRVQHALRELRVQEGRLIASACDKPPYGMYVCETAQEIEAHLAHLRSRHDKAAELYRRAKKAAEERDQGRFNEPPPPRQCAFCGAEAGETGYCSDFHEQLDRAAQQRRAS